MILDVRNIQTFYGESQALQGVTLQLEAGETVCILGRNGAGKSTTLKSIMGLTPPRSGVVVYEGKPVQGWPAHRIARAGIGYVPEDRRIFPGLTVRDNLDVASYQRKGSAARWTVDGILKKYEMLGERADQDGAYPVRWPATDAGGGKVPDDSATAVTAG